MDNTARANAPRFTARHVGLFVVIAALCVTIPRIMFAFALSDNLVERLGADAEFMLLMTSAIAGAVVLTTGNAYLSHILADNFHRRDALWGITASAWGVNLLFAVFIIAPTLMVGMQASPLANILMIRVDGVPTGLTQWAWCITGALAFELLAAGAMAGYAMASRAQSVVTPSVQPSTQPAFDPSLLLDAVKALGDTVKTLGDTARANSETVAIQLDALRQQNADTAAGVNELAGRLDEINANPPAELPTITDPRIRELVRLYLDDPALPYRRAGEIVDLSHTEVGNMVKSLRAMGYLPPAPVAKTTNGNGNGVHA